jgi:hypothetical protein
MKSKRNRMAGEHPSYDKLGMSEERKKKKLAYDKKYQATEERKNYRVELNKANRDAGTYGKMTAMGKDRSHKKDGSLVLEDKSKNRSRNKQDGKSAKK